MSKHLRLNEQTLFHFGTSLFFAFERKKKPNILPAKLTQKHCKNRKLWHRFSIILDHSRKCFYLLETLWLRHLVYWFDFIRCRPRWMAFTTRLRNTKSTSEKPRSSTLSNENLLLLIFAIFLPISECVSNHLALLLLNSSIKASTPQSHLMLLPPTFCKITAGEALRNDLLWQWNSVLWYRIMLHLFASSSNSIQVN